MFIQEEEIKFSAPSDALLEAVLLDLNQRLAPQATVVDRVQVDTYLDLAEQTLLQQGLALRLRVSQGHRWLELKGAGTQIHGVACRPEWRQELLSGQEISTSSDWAAGPVGSLVMTLVSSDPLLVPLFTVEIRRRSLTIMLEEQGVAEIAVDVGKVYTSTKEAIIREVEVERLAGPFPMALAQDLAVRHRLKPASHSKFFLGLTLLGWKIPGWE